MYEGALSTAFFIDDKHVGVMSFSIMDGEVLGLSPGPQLLLCRNQTTADRWYQKPLQDAFKHIALPYMMFAAVAGVANTLDLKSIYAITEDGHPHGEDKYVDLMKGSYSGFWEKYNATPVRKGIVEMTLPLESTPLDQVAANHRRRAKGRREVMALIAQAAQQNFTPVISLATKEKPVAAAMNVMPNSALVPLVLGICEIMIRSGDSLSRAMGDSGFLAFLT
jgi:Protein of unknown function (DUF535)